MSKAISRSIIQTAESNLSALMAWSPQFSERLVSGVSSENAGISTSKELPSSSTMR